MEGVAFVKWKIAIKQGKIVEKDRDDVGGYCFQGLVYISRYGKKGISKWKIVIGYGEILKKIKMMVSIVGFQG